MTHRHDADLCERIRKLEERVRELEAAPRVTWVPAPWTPPTWYYPGWTWTAADSGDLTSGTTTITSSGLHQQ